MSSLNPSSSFKVLGVRKVVPESKPSPKLEKRNLTIDEVSSARVVDVRKISKQVLIGNDVKFSSKDDIASSGTKILQGGGDQYKAMTQRKETIAELEAKAGRLQIETMFLQERLDALKEDKEV